jgi:hypothetical protein
MKYCKVVGSIAWSGGTMVLNSGQRFDDDHRLVRERPELFDDQDPGADFPSAPRVSSVERGTAAPGEIRETPGTGPRRVPRGGSAQ